MRRREQRDERPPLTAELVDGPFDALRAFCEKHGIVVSDDDLAGLGWPEHLVPEWTPRRLVPDVRSNGRPR